MSTTFTEALCLDDGTDVTVEFTQSQYYPATGASFNDPGSPAEGGEIEIVEVSTAAGVIKPSDAEMQRFYDELYAMPPREDGPDPELLYDSMRDDRDFFGSRSDWSDDS